MSDNACEDIKSEDITQSLGYKMSIIADHSVLEAVQNTQAGRGDWYYKSVRLGGAT